MSGEMWKEENKKTSEFFQPDDAKESNIALPVRGAVASAVKV